MSTASGKTSRNWKSRSAELSSGELE